MKNITFLIGNGFDLSFGVHSQYRDIYKAYSETQTSAEPFVDNFKEEIQHWSNFEMDLAKFAAKCSTEAQIVDCLRDFKQFTEDYLIEEQKAALYARMRNPKDTESKSNMESGKRGTHETSSKLCSESRSGDQMPDLPKRTASQRRRAYRPSQPAPVPSGAGRPCAMVFQMPEVRAANRDRNLPG